MRNTLGHIVVGGGDRRVLVLNDWLCDTSTWDHARVYLDGGRFTWTFADLRGYGRSREQQGAFGCVEAAGDVLDLSGNLGWPRFSVIGHSMSCLVALHLAQHAADRIDRIVLLTPPPPRGFGADDAAVAASQAIVAADTTRADLVAPRFAERLSPGWAAHKTARWLETSDARAAAGYFPMFARDGLPAPTTPVSIPVLAITGEEDAPPMRAAAVREALAPLVPNLELVSLPGCGHYPMQEMPPLTVALIERFLGR